MRKITIDGFRYQWRFRPGYRDTGDPARPYECRDRFTAFLEGYRRSILTIEFVTWEDAVIGGPLRTGAPIDPGTDGGGANLNEPRWAVALIQEGRRLGWHPELGVSELRVENGTQLLLDLLSRGRE